MKTNKILFGGLAALMLSACTNDMPEMGGNGQITENETTTYVRVALSSSMGNTRATAEYENGSADENKVNKILLTFFDAGRNYVGKTEVAVNSDNTIKEEAGTPGSSESLGNTVEKMLTVVAPVTLPENINYPKYVVAYVNPTSASADLATDKLEDAMNFIRKQSSVSFDGARTMNNSVYFDEGTGFVRFATEVDFKTHFFETMDEAKDAKDATIEITVERMEAKVRLSSVLNEIDVKPITSDVADEESTAYTLEFVPETWFANGTEKRSFLLKNFRSTKLNYLYGNAMGSDFGMSLNTLKDAFKVNNQEGTRWNEVNDQTNKRSYWAIDPTYFSTADEGQDLYPSISYDVKYGEINTGGTDYPLVYRSYKDVKKEQDAHTSTNYVKFADGSGRRTHEYVLENTMSYNTLAGTDAKASMTSVVLLGHYIVKKGDQVVFDGSLTNDTTKAFYVRHEAGSKRYVMINDEEAKNFFLERGGSSLFVQSIDKDGNKIENSYEPLRAAHIQDGRYGVSYEDFSLVYPGTDRTSGKKLSEQWRTMRLVGNVADKGLSSGSIYVYDADLNDCKGGYKAVKTLDEKGVAALKEKLYSTYGVLEKFQTGKAYFNVPLKHIWKAGLNSSNEFNPKSVVLGDYGVVRNHIYDLTINKIEGLGTGIGSIDQPIVPPTDNEQYYISTRLRILQWRAVKQGVDL